MRPIVLGTLLGLSALGQTQNKYSINGTVRNAVTGEPLRNVLVSITKMPTISQLGGPPAGLPEESQPKGLLSGPGGEFRFEGLPAGPYVYQAEKPGFARYGAEGNFVLPKVSSDAALKVSLTPLGAIEGKVVNQFDEPLENVVLDVYALNIRDGEKIVNNVGTVWTDDRGLFHLAWLEPGQYYVKAQGKRGGTETHFGAYAMRYAPWEGFSPVYFGGANDIGLAATIPVAAGTRVRADFRLEVEPSFKIRGKVEGYTAPETVSFELLRGNDRAAPSRAVFDVSTGEFAVLDVPTGVYRLRAAQEQTRGEVTVNVGNDDIGGVSIALLPPVTVKVSMRAVGGRGDAPRASGFCEVTLHQGWYADTVRAATREENGQFSLDDVFPGEYQVRLHCSGAYVQSATSGGVDLLTNPVLTISSGAPPPPIEVAYTPGGGSLKVKFANPVPSSGAVLLVPAFSASAGPALQPTNRSGAEQPGEDTFQFSNLAPGDYVVYRLPRFDDAEFRNPAFLQALSGGTSVRIEDGKTAEVAIMSISK